MNGMALLRVLMVMGILVTAYAQNTPLEEFSRKERPEQRRENRRRQKNNEPNCALGQLTVEQALLRNETYPGGQSPCSTNHNCPQDCPKVDIKTSGSCCIGNQCTTQNECDDAAASALIIVIVVCVVCYGGISVAIALCVYCANQQGKTSGAIQGGGHQSQYPMQGQQVIMAQQAPLEQGPPFYQQPQAGGGWTQHTDPNTGNRYESNAAGETRWLPEEPKPSNPSAANTQQWTSHTDPATGRQYESNAAGETRWIG